MTDADWTTLRAAYLEAADTFADVVEQLQSDDEVMQRTALGEWTVRDLVGHTARAVSTVEAYLGTGASRAYELESAVAYYVFVNEHTNHAEVADRGRQAGDALGERPAEEIRASIYRVRDALIAAQPDAVVATPAGRMRIAEYLPTRTCELVVHSLDLIHATGATARVPTRAVRQTTHLLVGLGEALGLDESVVAVLAGRDMPPLALFGGRHRGS